MVRKLRSGAECAGDQFDILGCRFGEFLVLCGDDRCIPIAVLLERGVRIEESGSRQFVHGDRRSDVELAGKGGHFGVVR